MWSLLTTHLQLRACRATKETTSVHALCCLDDAPLPWESLHDSQPVCLGTCQHSKQCKNIVGCYPLKFWLSCFRGRGGARSIKKNWVFLRDSQGWGPITWVFSAPPAAFASIERSSECPSHLKPVWSSGWLVFSNRLQSLTELESSPTYLLIFDRISVRPST